MIQQVDDYLNIRLQVKTGDLYFTGSNSFVSELIKFFTRSDDAHVGVFVWIEDRLFCAESTEGRGCQLVLASNKLKGLKFALGVTGRTDDQILEIKRRIFNDIGRVDYDWKGAALALVWDTKSAKQFCSEWAAYVLGWRFDHIHRGLFPSDLRSALVSKN